MVELIRTSFLENSPSSSAQAMENESPPSVESHCCRRDKARPRRRERNKMNFWKGVKFGVAWRELLNESLNSQKANSFWELSENNGSSNWGALKMNTGDGAGAELGSTTPEVAGDREAAATSTPEEEEPRSLFLSRATPTRHSNWEASSSIKAAETASSVISSPSISCW